ncbi:MAG: hypothetical protein ABFD92_16845 [Planctomycetaceae bacterium]|nr:hypothetical protein [Planctomycetaceae bacterium]
MPTTITVTNPDATILDSLVAALLAARISGAAAFQSAEACISEQQAVESACTGSAPRAAMWYMGTEETTGVDNQRNCVLSARLYLYGRGTAALDKTSAVREALRLVNAAKNAIEAAPPALAVGCGDNEVYHEPLRWGKPVLSNADDNGAHWVSAQVDLSVGYVLASPTSH